MNLALNPASPRNHVSTSLKRLMFRPILDLYHPSTYILTQCFPFKLTLWTRNTGSCYWWFLMLLCCWLNVISMWFQVPHQGPSLWC